MARMPYVAWEKNNNNKKHNCQQGFRVSGMPNLRSRDKWQHIVFEQRGFIAHIEFNRPQKMNSLIEQVLHELLDVFTRIKADVGIRAAFPTNVDAILERAVNPLMRAIRSLDRPVVCAVNGVAVGAGAALALSCDIVLTARSASFVQLFSKVGLGMDAGSSYFLPR
jgi:2-(1,2-epoxy-1,2-dihydrophenyl)acetyl-CoA isomerase